MERSAEESLLKTIHYAFEKGFDVDDPNSQTSQVVRLGVKRLREGKKLTIEEVSQFEKWGGTDHPDPWFG